MSKIERAYRLPIEILVDYHQKESMTSMFCRNLNASGMFIETTNPLEIDTVVKMSFELPFNKIKVEVEGIVRWTSKTRPNTEVAGMGIEYLHLSEDMKNILNDAVSYYKGYYEKEF